MQTRAKWTSTLAALAAVVLLTVTVTGMGQHQSGTNGYPSSPTDNPEVTRAAAKFAQNVPLPADCQPTDNPPPTEYGFVAKITKGSVKGGVMQLEGLQGRMCGIIRLIPGIDPGCPVEGKLIIPGDGVLFPDDLKTTLNVIPGMHPKVPTKVNAHPIEHAINCNGSSQDGLTLDLSITVDGRAGAFGLECAVPFSGIARTRITGDLFSGDYTGEFTLTGDEFHAGKVSNNDKYCPGELPGHVNRIAQLPGDGYRAELSGTVAIYQNPVS